MLSKKMKQAICMVATVGIMGGSVVLTGNAVTGADTVTETSVVREVVGTETTVQAAASRTISTGVIGSGIIGTAQNTQGEADTNSTAISANDTLTVNATSSASDTVNMWIPTTAEEKRLFSYVGKEKIQASVVNGNMNVNITNSVQGVKCHEAFQIALNGYSIARTYNIFPNNSNLKKPVYETEQTVELSMTIPAELQKEGRQFKMICVSKDGTVYELFDIDTNPATITFATNHFYAYALCYVD